MLPGPSPTTRKLQDALLRELAVLPDASRQLLLLVTAGRDLAWPELIRAARRLGLVPDDLRPVVDAGLVTVTDRRVDVRHPLVRSVVYVSASVIERAVVHKALAAVSSDAGQAAWHRAAAVRGRDEAVAAELAGTAEELIRRGAQAEAGAALRRAAALSPRTEDRARRLAGAAEALRRAGMAEEAAQVLGEALPLATAPEVVRQLVVTEWVLTYTAGTAPGRTADELVTLALELVADGGPGCREECLRLLLAMATRCWATEFPAQPRRRLLEALVAVPGAVGHPLGDLSLTLVAPAGDRALRGPRLAAAAQALLAGWPTAAPAAAYAAEAVHDLPRARATWERVAASVSRSGSRSDECLALMELGSLDLLAGQLAGGLAGAELSMRIAVDLDLPRAAAMAAVVVARGHAMRGSPAAGAAALRRVAELSGPQPLALTVAGAAWAAGLLALTGGRHAEAVAALRGTAAHPTVAPRAVADLVEAAVRADDRPAAVEALARAGEAAEAFGSDHLWTLVHRGRALLAEVREARGHFERSIAAGRTSRSPLELARTRLAYGEWLGVQHQAGPAREQLTAALAELDAAGARYWADRAAGALRDLGVVPARRGSGRAADASRLLTAQELRIAQLAADGRTDRDIADRLYLSHRTVAARLADVLRLLGLEDRTGLARALSSPVEGERP